MAWHFGYLDPDDLLSRLTSRQFAEWSAFLSGNPQTVDSTNYLIAQLSAIVANFGSKSGQAKTAADFLPWVDTGPKTPGELHDKIRNALGAVGVGNHRKP